MRVVHGDGDQVVPVECSSRHLKTKLPRAELRIMGGRDHRTVVFGREKEFGAWELRLQVTAAALDGNHLVPVAVDHPHRYSRRRQDLQVPVLHPGPAADHVVHRVPRRVVRVCLVRSLTRKSTPLHTMIAGNGFQFSLPAANVFMPSCMGDRLSSELRSPA